MPGAPPFSVLVVDDDPVCRRFAAETLRAAGHAVFEVATLAEATLAFRQHHPDVVLSDVELPDGEGTELAERLDATVPMLAMSADLAPARRESLLRAGFAGAIEKPLRATTLVDAIATVRGAPRATAPTAVREPDDAAGNDMLLDDAAALRATGSREVLAGLRVLLRDELPGQGRDIAAALAAGDADAARGVLHRLRSGCGFCGASRLERAAATLSAATCSAAAQAGFIAALDATLAALRDETAP